MQSDGAMSSEEVLAVVAWLETTGTVYQVNGGWAVDALVGRQTRGHRDLDVFVDSDRVDDLLRWLGARGYLVEEDWLPVRIELAGPRGRVDVHPMRLGPDGDGVQQDGAGGVFVHAARDRTTGAIGGRRVVVATAERQRALREGYAQREVDRHDLRLLRGL